MNHKHSKSPEGCKIPLGTCLCQISQKVQEELAKDVDQIAVGFKKGTQLASLQKLGGMEATLPLNWDAHTGVRCSATHPF